MRKFFVKLIGLHIFWSPPGDISLLGCWCCLARGGYLYIGLTLWELLYVMITEWRADRHLVGSRHGGV